MSRHIRRPLCAVRAGEVDALLAVWKAVDRQRALAVVDHFGIVDVCAIHRGTAIPRATRDHRGV